MAKSTLRNQGCYFMSAAPDFAPKRFVTSRSRSFNIKSLQFLLIFGLDGIYTSPSRIFFIIVAYVACFS